MRVWRQFAPSLYLLSRKICNFFQHFLRPDWEGKVFKLHYFDLADAARSSYGSFSRILLEAASPLSSHVVDLLLIAVVTGTVVVPGHQQCVSW